MVIQRLINSFHLIHLEKVILSMKLFHQIRVLKLFYPFLRQQKLNIVFEQLMLLLIRQPTLSMPIQPMHNITMPISPQNSPLNLDQLVHLHLLPKRSVHAIVILGMALYIPHPITQPLGQERMREVVIV